MLWQIIFLAAGILSLIYYGAICMGLYFFQILAGMRKYRNCRKRSDPFIWNAVDSRIADRYHGVPSFACRDEDHNRNVRKTFGKRSDGNR